MQPKLTKSYGILKRKITGTQCNWNHLKWWSESSPNAGQRRRAAAAVASFKGRRDATENGNGSLGFVEHEETKRMAQERRQTVAGVAHHRRLKVSIAAATCNCIFGGSADFRCRRHHPDLEEDDKTKRTPPDPSPETL